MLAGNAECLWTLERLFDENTIQEEQSVYPATSILFCCCVVEYVLRDQLEALPGGRCVTSPFLTMAATADVHVLIGNIYNLGQQTSNSQLTMFSQYRWKPEVVPSDWWNNEITSDSFGMQRLAI